MKLPAGTEGGTITDPQDEKFIQELRVFRGAVEIKTGAGNGFILTRDGKLVAAYFRTAAGPFRGRAALSYMTMESDDSDTVQKFHLRKYNEMEFDTAIRICRESSLLIANDEEPEAGEPAAQKQEPLHGQSVPPNLLDQGKLKKILNQPGVIAVSAFFEGFPVQSLGDADFEHVAASAEDFMRAGTKIAEEMHIGQLEQMILETADNKFIIAPCGDLYICVFTTADAQLGLIRVVLKNIQSEVCG
jgi:predicted regulator of Ras-like GTPase activity (Roadblock/LC7/MglB family)